MRYGTVRRRRSESGRRGGERIGGHPTRRVLKKAAEPEEGAKKGVTPPSRGGVREVGRRPARRTQSGGIGAKKQRPPHRYLMRGWGGEGADRITLPCAPSAVRAMYIHHRNPGSTPRSASAPRGIILRPAIGTKRLPQTLIQTAAPLTMFPVWKPDAVVFHAFLNVISSACIPLYGLDLKVRGHFL